MSSNHNFLSLIVRHLNNPSDAALKTEVDELRAQSAANQTYFNEVQRAWLLSAKAKPLDAIKEDEAVKRLKQALNGATANRTLTPVWFRNLAAGVLIGIALYWVYKANTKPVWLTKTTTTQIDSVKLNDGSTIVLAPNSQLKYPKKFDAGEPRNIMFSKGQAFFRIAKDARHPFTISINQSDVTVLGTSFNIQLSHRGIDLSVKTGKVMFLPYKGGNAAVLTAGQALNYDIARKQYSTKTSQNTDAWLTHKLEFEDMPLDIVCQQLTEYYKTPIKLKNNNKTIKKLNATFTNNTLNEVLEILSETYDIKVSKQPHQIILTSN